MAKSKVGSSSLVKWDSQFAELAKKTKTMEASAATGGNFIGTRGGQLTFQNAAVPNNTLDVVIIHSVLENAYYEGKFDPENPTTPVCFALGEDADTMRPHEKSTKPQHETCKGCKQNEWASADTGRGKACKNTRRIALITEADLADPVAAQTAYLKPPVTSIKSYAGHVKSIADTLNRPPLAVITTIKTFPDPKNQFGMSFAVKDRVENVAEDGGDVFEALLEKNKIEQEAILFPYTPMSDEQLAEREQVNKSSKSMKFAKKAGARR